MTALGVGIDLVDVGRVERLLQRSGERALRRLLTPDERAYCVGQREPAPHVAARIAAKEAAFKAFHSAGSRSMMAWREIEVLRADHGDPRMVFHDRAEHTARQLGVRRVLVSLSHSHLQAAAIVLLLG